MAASKGAFCALSWSALKAEPPMSFSQLEAPGCFVDFLKSSKASLASRILFIASITLSITIVRTTGLAAAVVKRPSAVLAFSRFPPKPAAFTLVVCSTSPVILPAAAVPVNQFARLVAAVVPATARSALSARVIPPIFNANSTSPCATLLSLKNLKASAIPLTLSTTSGVISVINLAKESCNSAPKG